jgi:dipeptidase E
VRLYLSSFRLGHHSEFLVRMAGQAARVAVVANAMDGQPPDIRRQAVERELAALSELQLRPAELDLRGYAGDPAALRHALHLSGGDTVLPDLLQRDTLAYAGYSAGPVFWHRACGGWKPWTTPPQCRLNFRRVSAPGRC